MAEIDRLRAQCVYNVYLMSVCTYITAINTSGGSALFACTILRDKFQFFII